MHDKIILWLDQQPFQYNLVNGFKEESYAFSRKSNIFSFRRFPAEQSNVSSSSIPKSNDTAVI